MSETTEKLTFEEALKRLEDTVRELESTDIGLDKSLERYEAGVQLLNQCLKILDEAERKIRLLTGVDAAGNPITTEFDATPTAEREERGREPSARRGRNTGKGSGRAATEPSGEGELF